MTLTLEIPSSAARADASYQAKLRRAAAALRDLITPEEAIELAGPAETPQNELRPPSEAEMAEWRAKLHQLGPYSRRTEPLSIEATSREYIYGDDLP